jgi:hypothetical protein
MQRFKAGTMLLLSIAKLIKNYRYIAGVRVEATGCCQVPVGD